MEAVLLALDGDDRVASILPQATVLLHGSTTRGIDDAFSDLDLWVLPSTDAPFRFIEFTADGKQGQLQITSRQDFQDRVRRCDFPSSSSSVMPSC